MTREEAKEQALNYPIEHFLSRFTERARNKGFYVCPICGSGSGNNGHRTGALSIKNNRVTCFANNCFRNNDIFDVTAELYGLRKGSHETFNKTYELLDIKVGDINMSNKKDYKEPIVRMKSYNDSTAKEGDIKADFNDYIIKCKADVNKTNYWNLRGIEENIIEQFNLGYDVEKQQVIIPYNEENTYYISRKIRPLNPSDRYRKPKAELCGQEPIFNEQALKKHTNKPLFCTEGQIDALSIIQVGYDCVARGGTGLRLIDTLKNANFNRPIIIVSDNDAPGRKSALELELKLREIGIKCKRIHITGECKDVNEFLIENKEEFYKSVERAVEEIMIDLASFHRFNSKGVPVSVIDKILADYIINTKNLFVMGSTPHIYEDGYYIADNNGTRLKEHIQKHIYTELINVNVVNRIYNLILSEHRIQKQACDLNQFPKHWINFKNGMFDVKEWRLYEHSPRYYSMNQLPHRINLNSNPEGKNVTKFLDYTVPDDEDQEMLLQFLGYCMTRDTSQQKFLILKGQGGTGKSKLIKMLENILGASNCSNISMQDLNRRFYAYGLFGKLLNSCADIPSEAMNSVDVIKKIVGEDVLMAEQKGKDSFSFTSYAKLMFSANEIPINLEEKSQAFYRRLLILKVDRKPVEVDTNLEQKLLEDTDYLILESLKALKRMYEAGTILESKNSKMEVVELHKDADTVTAYIDECLVQDSSKAVKASDLYEEYQKYCNDNDRTALTRHGFNKNLRNKGYETKKIKGYPYYKGLDFKSDFIPVDSVKLPFN